MFPTINRISHELRVASPVLRVFRRDAACCVSRSRLGARGSGFASVLLVCGLFACTNAPLLAQNPDTTFKVEVKLVNVFVTVTDPHGAPVASLQKENFVLQEDGKEQKIAVFSRESAIPLSIVLSIDTSLSTRKDLPLELMSARKFAHTILRP